MLHLGSARVSKEDQAFEKALQMQVERLQRSGCDRVYADIGSRDNDDRPGLQEIIKLIELGQVASLTVVRLDRLTSSPGLFERLSKLLQAQKVPLRVLDENIDIQSIDGEFAAGLQIYFSQRELKTIRMRIKKTYDHRRSKSEANTSVPWGYENNKGKYQLNNTPFICLLSDRLKSGEFPGRTYADVAQETVDTFFEVGKSAAKTVKAIHQRYGILKFKHQKPEAAVMVFDKDDEFKYSRAKNARKVFRWSTDGLRKWLKNPVLRGHTPYHTRLPNGGNVLPQEQWEIRYNTHPPLITPEQAREIDEAIALNKRVGGFGCKGNLNTFIGILTCATCGRNMRCQTIKKSEKYYQCRNYAEERSCNCKKMIRESVVMDAVVKELVKSSQQIADFATSPDEIVEPPEIQQLRQQLEGLERLGYNPAFDDAKSKIQGQIDKWRIEQESKINGEQKNRELLTWAFSDPDCWMQLDKETQQKVIRALVKNVSAVDGAVTSVVLRV